MPAGYRLIALDTVDSTNLEALRRVAAGAAHGTVVRAMSQTRGRGRRGRDWISPTGNLYATVIVRPDTGAVLGQLAFVAALGGADALARHVDVRFKWPNDLMRAGRKLGGILIEAERGAAAIGIGINLASAPEGTEIPATRVPGRVDPDLLLEDLCCAFDAWYGRWTREGFSPVREAWLARADGLGGPVEVRLLGGTVTGTFSGLDADGGLLLDRPDGRRQVIAAGDVFFGTP